jgi:hypothetical protein
MAGGIAMVKIQRILLSVISAALIVVCAYSIIQHNRIIQLKGEVGSQIVSKFESIEHMCSVVENRIEGDGANRLSSDLLLYVNLMITDDSTLMSTYSYFFEGLYEPMLNRLVEAESEQQKAQLIDAIKMYHKDVQEIRKFADSRCRIVIERDENRNPKAVSGDYSRYAELTDFDSSLYKEFSAFIEKKRSENVDRFSAIISKDQQ